jgi:hypothetical protein
VSTEYPDAEYRYAESHILIFILNVLSLNFVMLGTLLKCVVFLVVRLGAACRYAECHYAECHFVECHYTECRHAECH